jgi:hypothetical protein
MSLLASPRRRRRLAWAGGTLLVVAIVVAAVVVFADSKRLPPDNLRPGAAPVAEEREVPLTRATRREIDEVLDEFVPAAVGRHDLARAWELAGPGLRAGTTRRNWVAGDFPVHPYPYAEQPFRNWRKSYAYHDRVAIDLLLFPRAGERIGPIVFAVDLVRQQGRWLVNSMYPAAVLPAASKSSEQSSPEAVGEVAKPEGARLHPVWFLVPATIFGAVLLIPLGLGIKSLVRRRAQPAALPPMLGQGTTPARRQPNDLGDVPPTSSRR